ncbi:MAG: Ig-like domain-containing protein [Myxococcota bacterium]|nr:Ig-like domain-containing protein [Myxococcota bacterium]
MKRSIFGYLFVIVIAALAFSCVDKDADDLSEPSGVASITMALSADPHDVAGFLYEIICDNGFTHTEYVPLEEEFMPPWLDPSVGLEHHFADLFAVIPPGTCQVCATPMQDPSTPSDECAPATGTFVVEAEQTTEIVLWSQCEGDPVGAGDIVVGLNDPPVITSLDLYPSKFICTSENLDIKVGAEDPNGDPLTYTWQVTNWPEKPNPGTFTLTPDMVDIYHSTFVAGTPGYYELTVTISDPTGASTELTFPVHVSQCDVCCYIREKHVHVWFHTAQECEQNHGIVVDDERCIDDVCCALPNGTFDILTPKECEASQGHEAPSPKHCEEVCCHHKATGVSAWMLLGNCERIGGSASSPELCVEKVCCELKEGAFEYITPEECKKHQGNLVDDKRCGIGCCYVKKFDLYVDMSIEQCLSLGLELVDPSLCEKN